MPMDAGHEAENPLTRLSLDNQGRSWSECDTAVGLDGLHMG